MPDHLSEADIDRIIEARRQGKLPGQIAAEFNQPTEDPGADERMRLQEARRALSGEGVPPGAVPDADPITAGMRAGHNAGGRGSDRAMEAYVAEVFNAAAAGDPRVVSQGTVSAATNERWQADARARQLANREGQRR
jgi:hypothetical protein